MIRLRRVASFAFIVAMLTQGCGGADATGGSGPSVTPPTPSISMGLGANSASALQGGSASTTVTVSRSGGYAAPVDITLENAPTGVVGSVSTVTTTAAATTATMTISVASSVAAGTYNLSIRASGSGVTDATASFVLTVSAVTVGAFVLTASPVSVARGGTATTNVAIARSGGFTGSVGLSITGAPSGVTASFATSSVTSASATLSVTASATAAVGTYTMSVRGTASGIPDQTATVPLTITGGSVSGGSTTIDLTPCEFPNGWFAFQDGPTAPWVKVTGVAGKYSFSPTAAKIGLAYAIGGSDRTTSILYIATSELSTVASDHLCYFRKYVPTYKFIAIQVPSSAFGGKVGAMYTQTGELADYLRGGSAGLISFGVPTTGVHDMAIVRATNGDSGHVIVRRAVDTGAMPSGGVLSPPADFFGAGAAPLLSGPLSISNRPATGVVSLQPIATLGVGSCATLLLPDTFGGLGAELFGIGLPPDEWDAPYKWLTNNYPAPGNEILGLTRSEFPGIASRMTGIPSALQLPGELNGGMVRWVDYKSSSGLGESRSVVETYAGFAGHSYTLPSSMPAVDPTNVASTPYRRIRFQFTLPADLDDAATVRAFGGGEFTIRLTKAYLGGRDVDVTIPDFTAVADWSNTYGPSGTISYAMDGEKNTRTTRCTAGRSAVSSRYGVI